MLEWMIFSLFFIKPNIIHWKEIIFSYTIPDVLNKQLQPIDSYFSFCFPFPSIPMLLLYYGILAMFFSLVGLRFSKYRVNIIVIQTVIKVYLSYWIILFNFLASFLFINLFKGMDYYNDWLVNIRFNTLDWFMVLVILLVSSCVIVNSIDYLTIMESYLFLVYISLFQFCMITFVLSNDLIFSFLNWDWLGLISYLLINFWSSKLNCGIKAVLYNKCGDCFFLLVLAFSYSFINYYVHLPLSILFNSLISFIFSFIYSSSFYCFVLSFSLLFIFFSKSAQFPFSSWLLNSMSAPTPISALLHSSTMVIAGLYLGLIIDSAIILVINSFDWFYVVFILFPLFSLLWTLFKAISLTDIKSIIAFSTISQISYMFLAILIFPLVCLFHIIIHALFKSLLFLLAGSLINVQANFQSIYRMKPSNNSWVKIIFLLAGSVLILSLSKEGIIHSFNTIVSSAFVFILAIVGGFFTSIYTLKIYIYCFYRIIPWSLTLLHSLFYSSFYSTFYSSFILSFLIISCSIIYQSLDSCFSMNSFSLFYHGLDFESLLSFHCCTFDSMLNFSLLFFFSIPAFFLAGLILYWD